MLRGVSCSDRTPLPKGSVHMNSLQPVHEGAPLAAGALQSSTETPGEVSRDAGEGDDIEVVGFSTVAK